MTSTASTLEKGHAELVGLMWAYSGPGGGQGYVTPYGNSLNGSRGEATVVFISMLATPGRDGQDTRPGLGPEFEAGLM